MQNGSSASLNSYGAESSYLCPFCLPHEDVVRNTLKETETFRLIMDHAPVVEGHLLIMPKRHYACYGEVPAALDSELLNLKRLARTFLSRYYAPVVFWEHGVFRQTVFHAHLHCFPLGVIRYDPALQLHERIVFSQQDIRDWYRQHGHYFFLQDSVQHYLFAPRMEVYQQIMQQVIWAGVAHRYRQTHDGRKPWRSPEQRREEGVLLNAATMLKWQQFQEEERQKELYVDEAGA